MRSLGTNLASAKPSSWRCAQPASSRLALRPCTLPRRRSTCATGRSIAEGMLSRDAEENSAGAALSATATAAVVQIPEGLLSRAESDEEANNAPASAGRSVPEGLLSRESDDEGGSNSSSPTLRLRVVPEGVLSRDDAVNAGWVVPEGLLSRESDDEGTRTSSNPAPRLRGIVEGVLSRDDSGLPSAGRAVPEGMLSRESDDEGGRTSPALSVRVVPEGFLSRASDDEGSHAPSLRAIPEGALSHDETDPPTYVPIPTTSSSSSTTTTSSTSSDAHASRVVAEGVLSRDEDWKVRGAPALPDCIFGREEDDDVPCDPAAPLPPGMTHLSDGVL